MAPVMTSPIPGWIRKVSIVVPITAARPSVRAALASRPSTAPASAAPISTAAAPPPSAEDTAWASWSPINARTGSSPARVVMSVVMVSASTAATAGLLSSSTLRTSSAAVMVTPTAAMTFGFASSADSALCRAIDRSAPVSTARTRLPAVSPRAPAIPGWSRKVVKTVPTTSANPSLKAGAASSSISAPATATPMSVAAGVSPRTPLTSATTCWPMRSSSAGSVSAPESSPVRVVPTAPTRPALPSSRLTAPATVPSRAFWTADWPSRPCRAPGSRAATSAPFRMATAS